MIFSLILVLVSCFRCLEATTFITTDSHVEPPLYQQPINEQFEMLDLLDLGDRPQRLEQPNLRNSASKFLLEVYNEISESQEPEEVLHQRHKRSVDDDILISNEDRQEIASCNSILTFSSRLKRNECHTDLHITFNTNDVPLDLTLVQAMLRVYKQPSLDAGNQNLTISIYRRLYARQQDTNIVNYRILHSVNTTANFKGWLEFNLTQTLRFWLQHKTLEQLQQGHEVRISVTEADEVHLSALDSGIMPPHSGLSSMEPYIVGYFNGPELLVKIQKLRFKRELHKRKATLPSGMMKAPPVEHYRPPQSCERLNFTVDFKELQMHNWVIAPKKFEAYFCGGGCNFPLGTKMNATNHAIVQTLMHLKQPHLPKPCCVPTVLGAITILRYLSEDIIDLTKYQKAVARECGCH
ncbi:protein screw [Scaptodrosophila lebanonensis]|uniref:Protein screw n=2 Tax=victoria group TaxID=32386 RepID=A0A6J2TPT1_DROLE|nr:protein screw [Scaptodrosophila lebanonensis]